MKSQSPGKLLPASPPWLTVAITVVLAGIIHIVAILTLPHLAPKNAWARLSNLGDTNSLLVLPGASPAHQTLPFMAPDVRYALCRYDLKDGPVRLSTQLPDDLWVIAFYTPEGENFYTITGGDLKREKIDVIVSNRTDALLEISASILDETDDIVIVASPVRTGVALIRAPLPGPSYAARTELALQRASCSRNLRGLGLTE